MLEYYTLEMKTIYHNYLIIILLLFSTNTNTYGQVTPTTQPRADYALPPPPPPVAKPGESIGNGSSSVEVKKFSLKNGITSFEENGLWGLRNGESILHHPIISRFFMNTETILGETEHGYLLWNNEGVLIQEISPKYDDIVSDRGFYRITNNGLQGIIDQKGSVRVPAEYTTVRFLNDLIIVNEDDIGYSLYPKNEPVESFSHVTTFQNGFIAKRAGKYGYFGTDGSKTGFIYDSIYINNKNRRSYQSQKLKKVDPLKINNNYSNGPFIVKNGEDLGLLSSTSELILPLSYKNIYPYKGLIVIENWESRKALYSPTTKKTTSFSYDNIYVDGYTYITVSKDQKRGILNREFEELIPLEYESILWHTTGGFVIQKDGKQGWANEDGKIIIDPLYDELDDFSAWDNSDFSGFYKVKNNETYGIIDKEGKIIIPPIYKFINTERDYFLVIDAQERFGIISKTGEVVLPTEYTFIDKSVTKNSPINFIIKEDNKGIADEDFNIILPANNKEINYIHNTLNLLNPFSPNSGRYLYVKGPDLKVGVFDETTKRMTIPIEYDDILQKFDTYNKTYFLVRNKSKYGIIDELNQNVIPIKYDYLNIDHLIEKSDQDESDYKAIVAKKGKYGLVNFNHSIILDLIYEDIGRLDESDEIYKVKKDGVYSIMYSDGKLVHQGPYDDVAIFWGNEVLAFRNDSASVVNKNGYVQLTKPMKMHQGFTTFDDMKYALIEAINSETNDLLLEFAKKVAPSEHIQHFVLYNHFSDTQMYYDSDFYDRAIEKYYHLLLEIKSYYKSGYDDLDSLTEVNDYTLRDGNLITVKRTTDWAYGDRDIEKLLRNAFRVNGYWVSGYFLSHHYNY